MKKAFLSLKQAGLSNLSMLRLQDINTIVEIYAKQGYALTLRQLYYQLVIRNIIPNKQSEYAKLSILLTKGRMAGIVDWSAIEDRIRQPRHTYSVKDVADAILDAEKHYRLDRMEGQENYVELWVEKDALASILSRKTNYYHIRLMVNRGYSSTSAMYDSHERFFKELYADKNINILYLGDHDPSGLDMDRDIYERIYTMLTSRPKRAFTEYVAKQAAKKGYIEGLTKKYKKNDLAYTDGEIDAVKLVILDRFKVKRIGLTTAQVKKYNPPPNPAKIEDPRAAKYIAKHGNISWEVDALNPSVLHQLIDDNILALIDEKKFKAVIELENEHKEELADLPAKQEKLIDITALAKQLEIPKITKPKGKPTAAHVKKLLESIQVLEEFAQTIKAKTN